MKSIFRSSRHKSPHQNEENRQQQAPFFAKENKSPFFNGSQGALVQPKLKIGRPGDKYEREADNMADAVVNGSAKPDVQNKEISSIQRESLASPQEDEKLGTAEQRMEEDKLVQEKPELQKMTGEEEEEGMLNKMEGEEEEEGMQMKMEDEKEEIINRMEGEEEDESLQTKSTGSTATIAGTAITQKIKSKSGRGKAIPKNTRSQMEAAFGRSFNGVNIHTDQMAAELNEQLGAKAFTHGRDIFFNTGKYDTASTTGKHLLAHELTHVVQQAGATREGENKVQRQASGSAAPTSTTCGKPAHCPATFCEPFPFRFMAESARNNLAPILLAGIAKEVSPRVVPLWTRYLFGGSGPRNVSSTFGADFVTSSTTAGTTEFLIRAITARLLSSPPVFPAGVHSIVLNISSLIPSEVSAINTPGDSNEMDFNVIGEIPGNIAGGIGTTQLSCPVGARPSPFDDARLAFGTVLVNRLSDGSMLAQPFINYKVLDTIDLCPGNCGANKEQIATVPMSKMEASGISGDVPIIADFPSPPVPPILIPAPFTPIVQGTITASALRIRARPDLGAPILDKYPRGTLVDLDCQVTGSFVRGNNIWYKTDRGFISSEYVRLSGPPPAMC